MFIDKLIELISKLNKIAKYKNHLYLHISKTVEKCKLFKKR